MELLIFQEKELSYISRNGNLKKLPSSINEKNHFKNMSYI